METGTTRNDGPLQLDLDGILRKRLGKKSRYLPRFLTRFLERIICQSKLNEMLRIAYPREGSEFSDKILEYLDITLTVEGLENLPEGRYVFASNHPLGGLDGIALIKVLGEHYGDENVRFLVNDLLMNVEPLQNVFLPINKYGNQARQAAQAISDTYASDKQVLIFPAGLVSRLHSGNVIADLEWRKAFVTQAIRNGRDIVPVYFEALNRRRFYRLAKWRKKLGVKVNLEQVMLPSELCHASGKHFRIAFGKPVSHEALVKSAETPSAIAARIKKMVYALK